MSCKVSVHLNKNKETKKKKGRKRLFLLWYKNELFVERGLGFGRPHRKHKEIVSFRFKSDNFKALRYGRALLY